MKNRVINGVLFSCLVSLLIACSPKQEKPTALVVDTLQVKKEIQAKEDEFAATYNAREVKNIGYYADDATSFSQNKPPLVGKQAIVDYLIANMGSISKSNKISFTTNEIYISNEGNQVLEIGYYKVVDSANVAVNSGNYMSLFVKRDGRYVCLRDMSTSDMP
jgi:ketosteroid isomerase-like protein